MSYEPKPFFIFAFKSEAVLSLSCIVDVSFGRLGAFSEETCVEKLAIFSQIHRRVDRQTSILQSIKNLKAIKNVAKT